MDDIAQAKTTRSVNPILKTFLSVFALILVYSHAAIISNHFHPRKKLPVNKTAYFFWSIFSVFSYYQPYNSDYTIWAILEEKANPNNRVWVKLDVNDYFPFKRGEHHTRINITMPRYYSSYGGRNVSETYEDICKKVRKRYHLLYPDSPYVAKRAAIGMEWWPRNKKSFYELKKPELTKSKFIYIEKDEQ